MIKLFSAAHQSASGVVSVLYCGTDHVKALAVYKTNTEPGKVYLFSKPLHDRTRSNPIKSTTPKQEQAAQPKTPVSKIKP